MIENVGLFLDRYGHLAKDLILAYLMPFDYHLPFIDFISQKLLLGVIAIALILTRNEYQNFVGANQDIIPSVTICAMPVLGAAACEDRHLIAYISLIRIT